MHFQNVKTPRIELIMHQPFEIYVTFLKNLFEGYIFRLHEDNTVVAMTVLSFSALFLFSLTVIRSKCPSYVGTEGILVQEFKHVLKIITKEDKLKGDVHLSL